MSEETITFAFAVGEFLVPRGSLLEPVPPSAPRLQVVSRHSEDCPGGVQRHYVVRALFTAHEMWYTNEYQRFNEVELARWSDYVEVADQGKKRADEFDCLAERVELLEQRVAVLTRALVQKGADLAAAMRVEAARAQEQPPT